MDANDWTKLGLTCGTFTALVGLAVLAAHLPAIHELYMQVSGSLLGLLGIHHGHDLISNRGSDAIPDAAAGDDEPVAPGGVKQEPEGALQGPQVGEEVPSAPSGV
jgi:hypothetical protein